MLKNIRAVRGMKDYTPQKTSLWQFIEERMKNVLLNYGYREIRFPIVEQSALFKCSIGDFTDIVEKEMYIFNDRKGNSLTLRPEGTASCVRAGIENGLLYNQEQRLWYIGPMFRYERPQKGRYRQFNQLGVEVFGLKGPDIDAELIILTARLWKLFGIDKKLSLEINNVGYPENRIHYCKSLIDFLKKHQNILDKECLNRIDKNPFRILDSKNPAVQMLLKDAPIISDYLDEQSNKHFIGLCKFLEEIQIPYTINKNLIRGIDYYNHTVFEWISNDVNNKFAICGGGRYDSLVRQLGGFMTPAVGFAIGLERLVALVQNTNYDLKIDSAIDIYVIVLEKDLQLEAMHLTEDIRDAVPDLKLMINYSGGNFKKQLSHANQRRARIALIIGSTQVKKKEVILKDMISSEIVVISQNNVIAYLESLNFNDKNKAIKISKR